MHRDGSLAPAQPCQPAPAIQTSLDCPPTCRQVQVLVVVEDVAHLVRLHAQQLAALGVRACKQCTTCKMGGLQENAFLTGFSAVSAGKQNATAPLHAHSQVPQQAQSSSTSRRCSRRSSSNARCRRVAGGDRKAMVARLGRKLASAVASGGGGESGGRRRLGPGRALWLPTGEQGRACGEGREAGWGAWLADRWCTWSQKEGAPQVSRLIGTQSSPETNKTREGGRGAQPAPPSTASLAALQSARHSAVARLTWT